MVPNLRPRFKFVPNTVESQWLEHISDYVNLFEIWVVRAMEGFSMAPGQEGNDDILGKSFRSSTQ